jgi:hypothetical protein
MEGFCAATDATMEVKAATRKTARNARPKKFMFLLSNTAPWQTVSPMCVKSNYRTVRQTRFAALEPLFTAI